MSQTSLGAPTRSAAATLVAVDHARLLHPQHHPDDHATPFLWERGEGSTLFDAQGRRWYDALSGMWNVHLGHGRRELIEAAERQLSKLAYATAYAGATHRPAIELAERLARLVPPSIGAFYFTSSGGEATDASIRTARWYWRARGRPQKSKIVALERSYHGSTVGAASATGVPEFSEPFGPRLPGFLHIPSHASARFAAERDGVAPGIAAADLLEQAILREGAETVAAFVVEPIQGGGGGVLVPPDGWFPRIREICDRYDVLLIADEVITGFGRSGRFFAVEHWGIARDIIQFSKGITSGYVPLGGIGVSHEIKAALDAAPSARRWWHGNTCSAHPVASAVALATIDVIEREGLVERSRIEGARLLARLKDALGDHPNVGDIRGLGLLAGVELVADRRLGTAFPPERGLGPRLRRELWARGIYTRVLGETVCLAPPLTTPSDQIDRIVDGTVAAIVAALAAA